MLALLASLVLVVILLHLHSVNSYEEFNRRTRERRINEVLWLEELKVTNPAIYRKITEKDE